MSNITAIKTEIVDLIVQARAHRISHNEGGHGYNPYDPKIEAAAERLREAEIADYAARWDEIKARWIAAVAKYSKGGRVDMRDLPKIEAEAGITNSMRLTVKARLES